MFHSLYSKLVAVTFAVFLGLGLLFTITAIHIGQRYQDEALQKLHLSLAEHIIQQKPLLREGRFDQDALADVFHMLMVVNPAIELYLLDPQGRILSYSAPPERIKRTAVSLAPIRRFLEDKPTFPIYGDDPRSVFREKVFSAAPLRLANTLTGYLYVILGSEQAEELGDMISESYILRSAIVLTGGGFALALLSSLILFFWLTRRLRTLSAAVDLFQNGRIEEAKASIAVPARGRDEIARLNHAFGEMMERLVRQMARLRENDTQRRELVANVSHDLRTPLASMLGYLETLQMQGHSLSPEQREHLDIAVRQAHQLSRLVNELFELAKLDSAQTLVSREPVSLAELVQDIVQKYRLTARQKGVELHATLIPDIPPVPADIGLLVRLLENLLENALRHTPTGGRIAITLTRSAQRITVDVSDTGSGIPPEALPHIFDRFYRLENGRHDNNGGAGLGLAIALRIVELHGGTLRARSTPGAGTTISFDLPMSVPAAPSGLDDARTVTNEMGPGQ